MGDFSLLEMKALGSHISAFIVCHSLQKSSTAQKVYSHSSLGIYCIFLSKFMYTGFAALPAHLFGRGGEKNA